MGETSSPPTVRPVSSSSDDDEDPHNRRPFVCGVVEGFYGRPWSTDQRKDLFSQLKEFGLNSYMYSPKDDLKHRAYWRELYTVEEAEVLSNVIKCCKENDIEFYYAVSPGLDIVYSSSKEVSCLKRKFEQVSQFGCTAFALLFDDIEPEISCQDKEVFQSFAQAQVSVTNEIFQALNQPNFLFCPTEYCAARAVPSVVKSEYLATIGARLLPPIDIMWTGNKVISKQITVQQVKELHQVLRRPPVIWDNIHANDYDQKRMFLGPYGGRSTDLVGHLRGVMSNPNCEFEANFIPIHTLAQWSRCKTDASDSVSSDICANIRLETENSDEDSCPAYLPASSYHPKRALKLAIKDWMPQFDRVKWCNIRPSAGIISLPPDVKDILSPQINNPEGNNANDSALVPMTQELVNSLAEATPVILNPVPSSEPMDCSSPKPSDTQMSSQVTTISSGPSSGRDSPISTENEPVDDMHVDLSEADDNRLTEEDVSLLVDLFYLPFDHGAQGVILLQEFQWLRCNSHLVGGSRKKSAGESDACTEWRERAGKFEEITLRIGRLFKRLSFIKNRTMLYEFYPYVWDIKGITSLLNSYIKWLEFGSSATSMNGFVSSAMSWFSRGYKEAFCGGDQEPWIFRGGLTGELQRLLPIDSVSDLFLYKAPESPSSHIFTIRPFLPEDESSVYRVSLKLNQDMDLDEETRELIGSKRVGGFLRLSPELCFVVEDEVNLCGYALSALDAVQFDEQVQVVWIPDVMSKFPPNGNEPNSRRIQLIQSMATEESTPNFVLKSFPSILNLHLSPNVLNGDISVVKRLLACVLTALKANGSIGVHMKLSRDEKDMIESFTKLGFSEINDTTEENVNISENTIYLGRSL